jgi:hypothetical protein
MSNMPPLRRLNRSSGLMQRVPANWGRSHRLTQGFSMTNRERSNWVRTLKENIRNQAKEAKS